MGKVEGVNDGHAANPMMTEDDVQAELGWIRPMIYSLLHGWRRCPSKCFSTERSGVEKSAVSFTKPQIYRTTGTGYLVANR